MTTIKSSVAAAIQLLFLATTPHAVETTTAHFKGRVTGLDRKPLPELTVMINRYWPVDSKQLPKELEDTVWPPKEAA